MISKTRINTILFALLGKKLLVEMWWNSPNKAFDGKTPNEIEDLDKIYTYLMRFM